LLLGAAVFALAAMTGALLAGAAPAVPAEVATVKPLRSQPAEARAASEAMFAQSMVYSGTAGLTLSIAGLVMVARRRRFW
jgi:hypothetical protein